MIVSLARRGAIAAPHRRLPLRTGATSRNSRLGCTDSLPYGPTTGRLGSVPPLQEMTMRTKSVKLEGARPFVETERDPSGIFLALICSALFGGACWAALIGLAVQLV